MKKKLVIVGVLIMKALLLQQSTFLMLQILIKMDLLSMNKCVRYCCSIALGELLKVKVKRSYLNLPNQNKKLKKCLIGMQQNQVQIFVNKRFLKTALFNFGLIEIYVKFLQINLIQQIVFLYKKTAQKTTIKLQNQQKKFLMNQCLEQTLNCH